jgi:lysophospholipase-1
MANPNALSTPIFWGHGMVDQLVLLDFSKKSVELLTTQMGVIHGKPGAFGGLSYHLYDDIGHTTNQKELEDLKAFIKNAVPFEDIERQASRIA